MKEIKGQYSNDVAFFIDTPVIALLEPMDENKPMAENDKVLTIIGGKKRSISKKALAEAVESDSITMFGDDTVNVFGEPKHVCMTFEQVLAVARNMGGVFAKNREWPERLADYSLFIDGAMQTELVHDDDIAPNYEVEVKHLMFGSDQWYIVIKTEDNEISLDD